MLNYVWGFLIISSIVCASFSDRINELSSAIIAGPCSAIELVISITGIMCFFSGIMKIAENSGLTKILSKLIKPIAEKLFPDYKNDEDILSSVCMNLSANFLGLGNAATPFGIKAIQQMAQKSENPQVANRSMIMFVLLNTASIQLIPTMMCALRQHHNSQNPMQVLPLVWVASITSLFVGIIVAKIFEKRRLS